MSPPIEPHPAEAGARPAPGAATAPHGANLAARWHVQLLGGFRLRNDAGQEVTVAGRSAMLLLARLACGAERSHPREELVELLWPGVDLQAGRNRLRQTLWVLRSVLEAPGLDAMPVLVSDRQALRLAPGTVACDATHFERLVRERCYDAAAGLYGGELLPGFYEEWVDEERLRLAALLDRCHAAQAKAQPATPAAAPAAPMPAAATPLQHRAASLPSSLPAYVSRAYGIDAQASRLAQEVQAHRLLTLIGAGGTGKTRLAVELAHRLAAGVPAAAEPAAPAFDSVHFVALLACHSVRDMADAMAQALHARTGTTDDALGPMAQALAGRRALLVLDNFEQLPAQASLALGQLLARLPQLHLLVTSRRSLGLEGEREFRIQPLPLPAAGLAPAQAALNPAVALFVDRARAARDSFRLTERNVDAVCRLVHALEGAPLAIELAAARVRSHPLPLMLDMLQPGAPATAAGQAAAGTPVLDLLSRGGASGPGHKRHDSLRRVIEWSWQQLDPSQAVLLSDLSLFTHSCPLPAAAAVAGLANEEARLRLDELQAHCLLNLQEDEHGELRVALSAPVREFAASWLDAARAPTLRARLRRWMRVFGQAQPATPSLPQMRQELPHLQLALAGAASDGAGEEAVEIVLALRAGLSAISVPKQVVDALEAAVDQCADAALRCRGRVMLVVLRYELGEPEAAFQQAERALAEVPAGDGALRARALHRHAYAVWLRTRDHARLGEALQEALALARTHGQIDTEAGVLAIQAMLAGAIDRDYARNEALHRQVLSLYQRLGNQHLVNAGLYNLAICASNRGDHAEALQRLQAVSEACVRLGDVEFQARAAHVRGNALASLRRWPESAHAHREAIEVAFAGACLTPLAHALMDLPRALAHLGQPGVAIQLAGFIQHYWPQHLGEPGHDQQLKLRRIHRLVATQLSLAQRDALQAQGVGLSLPQAVRLALAQAQA